MSNIQMREKLRKVTKAVVNHEAIPDRTKNIGLLILFIFTGLGILSLFGFAAILFLYKKWLAAFITTGVASVISFITYKIQSADELPEN